MVVVGNVKKAQCTKIKGEHVLNISRYIWNQHVENRDLDFPKGMNPKDSDFPKGMNSQGVRSQFRLTIDNILSSNAELSIAWRCGQVCSVPLKNKAVGRRYACGKQFFLSELGNSSNYLWCQKHQVWVFGKVKICKHKARQKDMSISICAMLISAHNMKAWRSTKHYNEHRLNSPSIHPTFLLRSCVRKVWLQSGHFSKRASSWHQQSWLCNG